MGYESTEMWLAMKQTKYKRTLEFLHNVLKQARGDMNEAVKLALDTVCDAVHAEAGTFWFYSRFGDGMIHPRAQFGGKPLEGFFLAQGEGIAGQVIEKCESMLVSDCRKDPRWAERMDAKTGFITKSMICVPLLYEDNKSFGCIQLINRKDDALFDEKDLELVEALASEISVGFVNLNLLSDGKTVEDVAVMFVDIRNFSPMCRKLEPVQVADMVNRFLSFVTTIVNEYEGVPNKYIGDCVLIYWTGEDAAKKACEAAVRLMKDAPELRMDMKKKLGYDFKFGIGINFGEAFIGNVGASVLSDHTVYGNMVNEAFIIESNAPGDKIYISQSVQENLSDNWVIKKVPGISLRDKKLNLKVFSLEY